MSRRAVLVLPPAALVALLLSSCYRVGGLYQVREVNVPIFDNASERRTLEFELTESVVQEMTRRGIRVNKGAGAPTLLGRILDIRGPSRVEGTDDVVLVGSLLVYVEIRLVDANQTVLWEDRKTESVSFSQARLESLDTARREVFDRLARWVVTHLEIEW